MGRAHGGGGGGGGGFFLLSRKPSAKRTKAALVLVVVGPAAPARSGRGRALEQARHRGLRGCGARAREGERRRKREEGEVCALRARRCVLFGEKKRALAQGQLRVL
jgi:hypothetical protein